jgi:hypothetical protein
MFGVDSKSYPTSINMIMSHISLWLCREVHLNNTCTSFEQTCNPIRCDHESLLFSLSTCKVDFLSFIDDFHLETKVILNREAFIFTLAYSSRLFSTGLLDMVYELLWNCFVLDDFMGGFDFFFKLRGHIIRGHIPS